MKSDLIDLELYVHHETEKAYLVSNHGDKASAVWIPKSNCERDPKNPTLFTMPEWLAIEKRLI